MGGIANNTAEMERLEKERAEMQGVVKNQDELQGALEEILREDNQEWERKYSLLEKTLNEEIESKDDDCAQLRDEVKKLKDEVATLSMSPARASPSPAPSGMAPREGEEAWVDAGVDAEEMECMQEQLHAAKQALEATRQQLDDERTNKEEEIQRIATECERLAAERTQTLDQSDNAECIVAISALIGAPLGNPSYGLDQSQKFCLMYALILVGLVEAYKQTPVWVLPGPRLICMMEPQKK